MSDRDDIYQSEEERAQYQRRGDRFVSDLSKMTVDNSQATGKPFDLFPGKDQGKSTASK